MVSPEFQAIIQGSYRMSRSARFSIFPILVDNAGDAVGTIDARFPISAIGTIFPNSPDNGSHRTIGAIFTVEANLAILSVFAVDHYRVSRQGFIQLDGDIAVGIHFGSYVLIAVLMAIFDSSALDGHRIT